MPGGLNWGGMVPGSGIRPNNSMFNPQSTGGGSMMPGPYGMFSNMLGGLGNLFGGALGGNAGSGAPSMFNPTIPGSSNMPGALGTFSNILGGLGNFPGALLGSLGHLFTGTLGQHAGDSSGYSGSNPSGWQGGLGEGDTGPTSDANYQGTAQGTLGSEGAGGDSGPGFWQSLLATVAQRHGASL